MNLAPLVALALALVASVSGNLPERLCTKHEDCQVEENHEECSIQDFLKPSCTTGTCECQPCYVRSPIGICVKKRYIRKLGMLCNETLEEVITIPRAECVSNTVVCTGGSLPDSANETCVVDLKCNLTEATNRTTEQCPLGTSCGPKGWCLCERGTKWNHKTMSCLPRELDEPCRDDRDCRFVNAGVEDFDLHGYVLHPLGKCVKGKCSCPEFGYKRARVGYIDRNRELNKKSICVLIDAALDKPYNHSCILDPIRGDPEIASEPPVCSEKHICGHCQRDGNKQKLCRKFASGRLKPESACYGGVSRLGSLGLAFTVLLALVGVTL